MLSSLSQLLYGEPRGGRSRIDDASVLLLVNREKPLRDSEGRPLTTDELYKFLLQYLAENGMAGFSPVVTAIIDRLRCADDALAYFVLVATLQLQKDEFVESLQRMATGQGLMKYLHDEYRPVACAEPFVRDGIPQLAWDVGGVVSPKLADVVPESSRRPAINLANQKVCSIDDHGLLTAEYIRVLRSVELLECVRRGAAVQFLHVDRVHFINALRQAFVGRSSDVFQEETPIGTRGVWNGGFQLRRFVVDEEMCRAGAWRIGETRTAMHKYVQLANRLVDVRGELAKFECDGRNSLKTDTQKLIFEFARREIQGFWETMTAGLKTDKGDGEESASDENHAASERIDMHDEAEKVHELARTHHQVLSAAVDLLTRSDSITMVELQELAHIGSVSATNKLLCGAWRRLNLFAIQFITRAVAEALSTPDRDLLNVFHIVDAKKAAKCKSLWQMMSGLRLQTSLTLDGWLASNVVDLVITYRLIVESDESDELNRRLMAVDEDAHSVLTVFNSTAELEAITEEAILASTSSACENVLRDSINAILTRLPSVRLVKMCWQMLFDDLLDVYRFAYRVFVRAHLVIAEDDYSNPIETGGALEKWLVAGCGYEKKYLRCLLLKKDTIFNCVQIVLKPPMPIDKFVRRSDSRCYSHVNSLMCLLQRAHDRLVEARYSELLRHEPLVRAHLQHMYNTMMALKTRMLMLINAAWDAFEKQLTSIGEKGTSASFMKANTAHKEFLRAVDAAVMRTVNRGATAPIIHMMVESAVDAAKACIQEDAVNSHAHYQRFVVNLTLFVDQCKMDRETYTKYRILACEFVGGTPESTRPNSRMSDVSGQSRFSF